MGTKSEIPIIDISGLADGKITSVHQDFLKAYRDIGFGYIVGHGIPDDSREGVFEASRRLHALPRERKLDIALNQNHRGFIPINTSTDVNSKLADVKKPNQSESFMMMREDAPDSEAVLRGDYLAGPNQWPELDGFREALEGYNAAMVDLGRRLMQAATVALGADWSSVRRDFETPTTWLRLLHYPPTEPDPDGDLFGSAPHTDFGCLTILAQDQVGG